KINFATVTVYELPSKAQGDFAGAFYMEGAARQAIERLSEELDKATINRTLPPRDESLGADYACYNAASGSLSYDIVPWLIEGGMARIAAGAPAPLKVHFWFGRDGKAGRHEPVRRQMFDNVVRPALALIGAIEDKRAADGRSSDVYTPRDIV